MVYSFLECLKVLSVSSVTLNSNASTEDINIKVKDNIARMIQVLPGFPAPFSR